MALFPTRRWQKGAVPGQLREARPSLLEPPDPVDHIVDPRDAAWAQHAVDLRQAVGRVRPVVQREGAHHDVEARVGKRERGDVADAKRHAVGHAGPGRQRVRPRDHLGRDVDTRDLDLRRQRGELGGQPARP